MTRSILERVLLFAVPFLLYGAYLLLLRLRPPVNRPVTPWTWLTIAGMLLVALSFLVVGFLEGEPITGLYVAPHVVNGKIVPGYVAPAPEKTK
ncbi:MAG: DUF6111 family protein [Rhizomicrobium sp.]